MTTIISQTVSTSLVWKVIKFQAYFTLYFWESRNLVNPGKKLHLFTNFQHFINTMWCTFFINQSRHMNNSLIDPLKNGITNMNKSPIHREIEINGISVISLTKMRRVEENFSFVCVYDVFTIINGNDMSWFTNKHCIKYTRIQVFTDPYFPVYDLQFCPYTREYGSVKTLILA